MGLAIQPFAFPFDFANWFWLRPEALSILSRKVSLVDGINVFPLLILRKR